MITQYPHLLKPYERSMLAVMWEAFQRAETGWQLIHDNLTSNDILEELIENRITNPTEAIEHYEGIADSWEENQIEVQQAEQYEHVEWYTA